jgi:hypothetical protein
MSAVPASGFGPVARGTCHGFIGILDSVQREVGGCGGEIGYGSGPARKRPILSHRANLVEEDREGTRKGG